MSFVWRPWLWQTCTEFGWYQTTNQAIMIILTIMITGPGSDKNKPKEWIKDSKVK